MVQKLEDRPKSLDMRSLTAINQLHQKYNKLMETKQSTTPTISRKQNSKPNNKQPSTEEETPLSILSPNDYPAGCDRVREIRNRGTGFFCLECESWITPIWVRFGKYVFPGCNDCLIGAIVEGEANVETAEKLADA